MKNDLSFFAKIQATGNDFIVFDSQHVSLEELTPDRIRSLCDRHFGVGADGLILLRRLRKNTIRMYYFNSDGSKGAMCGNGLRAAARYARFVGFCPEEEFDIVADDGLHSVRFNPDKTITVQILDQQQERDAPDLNQLNVPEPFRILGFLQVGVPHLVLEIPENTDDTLFLEIAPKLRHHSAFNEGTNVNLIRRVDEGTIKVRTFERGVEAETLSCGTGVTASVLLYGQAYPNAPATLSVLTKGGNLKVSKENGRITLTGPVKIVFTGEINLNNLTSE